jgi:multicomponent Na+:H+ antiporter subunit A
MSILIAVLLGFFVAIFAPVISRALKHAAGWALALIPGGLFVWFATFLPLVSAGETFRESTPWVPYIDIHFSFYLDGLSLLFSLIITGIGTFIVIYGSGYLKGHRDIGRFYLSLLMFMGSMLGVVLSDNLLTLFIFWELTSFTSYLLIGYYHEKEASRKAALQALLVTGTGGLALLGGLLLMAVAGGSMEITDLILKADGIREHGFYIAIVVLVCIGAFTKSAQFPFHYWLPAAMEAPAPVSAYLHSATMVKAGVYLLARFNPLLGGTDVWMYTLTGIGALTMVAGAWLALCFTDMKRILAYSTVMALGTLVMLIGIGNPFAIEAMVVFLLGHSLYKGALFMMAGSVDHETGARDILQLGGLRKLMPFTATFGIMAAFSMAGIMLFLGFIGKELVYGAAIGSEFAPVLIASVAVLANMAVVASAGIVTIRPFFGEWKETPKKVHEAPFSMWLGPAVLSITGLIFGFLPLLISGTIMVPAAAAVSGVPMDFYLAVWHGINLPLILSIITLLGGVLIYKIWDPLRTGVLPSFKTLFGVIPESGYDRSVSGMLSLAYWQTLFFQSGYLRYYVMTIIGFTVLLVGFPLITKAGLVVPTDWGGIHFYEWLIAALMIAGVLSAATATSGLVAVISLGVVGYSIALIYLLFSAPDLAITQILVETLTVILVALVLIKLPGVPKKSTAPVKVRNAIISVSVGLVVTLCVFVALSIPFDPFMVDYFAENSYVVAHGRNIVNVILVDFRALDTLGEITVLAVAGVGIFALIKLKNAIKVEKRDEGALK